ncbi:hypothetical protein PAAG_03435 [Paracoccidioides lutzii Pb01]|uniref:Uncharacterized protein n=1 Tax=Paracoccidioides lutzii (strain ATCC MYA-826 / Pb01) TaxID=502779 RepID=C1GX61_PARBA|nr:hypothetical protein PAAG_03435 [Paracoccidioides lutzii Pb01]EEH41149.2 hypothetical protein PAAG_03435 [Paracoccidioides lutzii Pb01]
MVVEVVLKKPMGSLQLRKTRRAAQIRNKRGIPSTIWQRKAKRLKVQAAAVLPKCERHNYDGCCGSACVLKTDDDDTDNLRKNQLQHLKTLQSLLGTVQITIGTLKPDNAAALWEKISTGYTVLLAEEFYYLVAQYKELSTDTEDFHDIFLLGNRDNQQVFVKTKINKFDATGQGLVSNIDIDDLTKQLTNCTNKTQGCGMSEHLVSECHHPYEQYDVQFIYHDVCNLQTPYAYEGYVLAPAP